METKALHVEMKDEAEGIVTARFATLGVKDKDGDLIERGAFGKQNVKVSSYGHGSWGGQLPVGVGEIHEKGDEAIADLRFFMGSQSGRDHFEVVKGLGPLGEWSFGFEIAEEAKPSEEQAERGIVRVLKKLNVFEVSPVLRGAGQNTATLSAKCDACAIKDGTKEPEPEPEPEPQPEPDLRAQVEQELARYALIEAKMGRL